MVYLKFLKILILDLFSNFTDSKSCDHDYQTVTNLYGKEVINVGFKKYKSIKKCKHCGFVAYSTKRDKECNIVNRKYRIYK